MDFQPKTPKMLYSENVILVDWLTVTFHDVTLDFVKGLLGLDTINIDWRDEQLFRNGYPRQMSFSNIAIRYGADKAENYTDDIGGKTAAEKVRTDMGIQLDMSGNGCRAFESYGHSDWMKLFFDILSLDKKVNITRIDLAYDDHDGILPLRRIADDTLDRFYTGAPKKTQVLESDDQQTNIRGLTVYVGSQKSMLFIRFYDKAAERGYGGEKHWVRVELVFRHDRANAVVREILERCSIGDVFCGVLRNYCCFREEANDSNKSRWPIADYWQKLLNGVERVRLFSAPGEEYNFRKTQEALLHQYGQAIQVFYMLRNSMFDLLDECRKAHPSLKPKYQKWIEEERLRSKMEQEKRDKLRAELALSYDDNFPIIPGQIDIADIFVDLDLK